ncbi:hypothetical protein L1987_57639 [Smallanthus sonchifolius]|uniref:Uncharacterized protein n=1 Tax=Smallanthus sonchifolius TaxID=185202 RepID=A0ACB9DDL0_9ASTR|nr:hypothetical protein L1987_57639 [Smallanthus sonchifolius]
MLSSGTAFNSVLYPANLSNEEVNNIIDKQGVILQHDDSSDELEIQKEKVGSTIYIHTIEKFSSPWNMDKIVERLKNKRVEETKRATKSKKPFKACFKCGQEGHLLKHCKQATVTRSFSSKRHVSEGKGNKICFIRSKSQKHKSLNNLANMYHQDHQI